MIEQIQDIMFGYQKFIMQFNLRAEFLRGTMYKLSININLLNFIYRKVRPVQVICMIYKRTKCIKVQNYVENLESVT